MAIQQMHHVGVVVDDLPAAIAFFVALGMELEGESPVSGEWVDRVVGLDGVEVDIAMVRTPDGHSRLELTRFRTPQSIDVEQSAPANAVGLRRVMFSVDDLDDVLVRLRAHGGELVGEVVPYGDVLRICYVRGPAGIIVALSEPIG
ncbi:VOC family protein [Actinosynnema sp. NPDC050436]|uniref:VOC family protein n=1 Tax=Actinosynnema sp. NPDC050436 TaxID=3155659 RepID=UPI003407A79A